MSEKMKPLRTPAKASDLTPEWLQSVRANIVQASYELRAGINSSIEIKQIRPPYDWMFLNLPGEVTSFVSDAERDQVLEYLRGGAA